MTEPATEPSAVRRSISSLFVANLVSFAAIGVSYLFYSRLLTPVEFGLYATALVIGSFGQLVLDGGLKNTLIKSPAPPNKSEQGTLLLLMLGASVVLTAGLLAGYPVVGRAVHVHQGDYSFLATFGAIWLLSYPWLAIPTAFLERSFRYRRLAVIESVGQVLERAAPALFLVFTPLGIWSFVAALALGRLFRVVAITASQPISLRLAGLAPLGRVWHFVSEGAWLQAGVLVSLVRDNLHVLLIGPLFGPLWVGYYGWALQLAVVCSQAFVQISARVSIPMFAQTESGERRWANCLQQVRLLSMLTAPVLAAILLVMPSVNGHLFHGKWVPALLLLPLIFLRMLPGLATTPVGSLVMVDRGGRALSVVLGFWLAVELAGAIALCLWLGPIGLAWSYSGGAWIGLWILVASLHRSGRGFLGCVGAILARPSLVIAAGLVGPAWLILTEGRLATIPLPVILPLGAGLALLAYASEGELRRYLQRLLIRPRSADGVG